MKSKVTVSFLLFLFLLSIFVFESSAAASTFQVFDQQRSRSIYLKLGRSVLISAPTTIVQGEITFDSGDTVFFQSDGTYKPKGKSAANIYIAVDGHKASNDSITDWRTSARPTAHPFDAVGAITLPAGHHSFALIAEPSSLPLCVAENCKPTGAAAGGGSFIVVAGASLSILVHPATQVVSHLLTADKGPYNLKTAGHLTEDNQLVGKLPWISLISIAIPPSNTAVAFVSGWLYAAGHGGDAMLSLLVNHKFPGNNVASWTNQDTWSGAESRGSLSAQGFLPSQATSRKVTLATVEDPWAPSWGFGGEDPLIYSVAAGTEITVLSGTFDIVGSASGDSSNSPNASGVSIGSSTGDPYSPPVGTNVELASANIDIPMGSDGVVMFSAKSGTHGGDSGSTVSHGKIYLWITIDGHAAGAKVFQEIAAPSTGSRRPISVSYLATGSHALTPGSHLVQVWGRAMGYFVHAYMWRDLPLVWFD